MNVDRYRLAAALFTVAWFLEVALAQSLPAYRKFDPEPTSAFRLRPSPVMLSRFPTSFSVARTADGKKLRSVDIDGRVWQWLSRETVKPVLVSESDCEPSCAVLSTDANWLAFADPNGHVVVLELDTGHRKFRDATAEKRTVAFAFSPDSRALAGVTVDGKVRVWDVGSGKVICEFAAPPGPVQTLAFSSDGSRLALASFSHEVRLYPVGIENGSAALEPQVIHVGASRVTAFAFVPGGKQLVIATSDGAAYVYDLATNRKVVELGTHPFAVWSIVFEPDGRRVALGSWDGTIKLWDTQSWELLQSVKTHEESVAAMVFDSQHGLISAGLDGRLLYWLPDVPSIRPIGMIAGRASSVWVTAYSPDGKRLFVGGREHRFELWDVADYQLISSRKGHGTTRCAAFSPDGKTLATGGDDGTISLCNGQNGETRSTLARHRGAVSAVVFADEGQTLISGCDGGDVKRWDVETGQEKSLWREHRQQIYCASVSPDGKWLITGGGNWTTGDPGELIVWELKTGRVRARLAGHKLAVWTVVFTRDGTSFMSSDSSGAVKVWNIETLEEQRTLQHPMWVRALALSPDGSTLAVGRGDGSIRLWDTRSWTEKASCEGHDSFCFAIQFAPGGGILASSGNDGTVQFWNTKP